MKFIKLFLILLASTHLLVFASKPPEKKKNTEQAGSMDLETAQLLQTSIARNHAMLAKHNPKLACDILKKIKLQQVKPARLESIIIERPGSPNSLIKRKTPKTMWIQVPYCTSRDVYKMTAPPLILLASLATWTAYNIFCNKC
jgi:hypothetical protein